MISFFNQGEWENTMLQTQWIARKGFQLNIMTQLLNRQQITCLSN